MHVGSGSSRGHSAAPAIVPNNEASSHHSRRWSMPCIVLLPTAHATAAGCPVPLADAMPRVPCPPHMRALLPATTLCGVRQGCLTDQMRATDYWLNQQAHAAGSRTFMLLSIQQSQIRSYKAHQWQCVATGRIAMDTSIRSAETRHHAVFAMWPLPAHPGRSHN